MDDKIKYKDIFHIVLACYAIIAFIHAELDVFRWGLYGRLAVVGLWVFGTYIYVAVKKLL